MGLAALGVGAACGVWGSRCAWLGCQGTPGRASRAGMAARARLGARAEAEIAAAVCWGAGVRPCGDALVGQAGASGGARPRGHGWVVDAPLRCLIGRRD